jgi:hypothetical protein
MERAVAAYQRETEQLRVEIKRAGEHEVELKRQAALEDIDDNESVLDEPRFHPPQFMAPPLTPLEPLEFDDSTPLLSDDAIEFEPPKELDEKLDQVAEYSRPPGPTTRQRWAIASSAILAILLVVSGAAALLSRHSARVSTTSAGAIATPAARKAAPVTTKPIVAAPVVVATPTAAPAATDSMKVLASSDSLATARARQWMDSLRETYPLRRPRPVESTPAVNASESSTTSSSAPPAERAATPSPTRDTIPRRVITSVTDSIFNFRNTPAKPDTTKPRRQ